MKIVVLGGGISTEREVALVTSTSVCKALRSLGHKAIFVDMFMGLENYDGALEDAFNVRDGFCGTALPLNDDQLDEMYKETEAANKAFFRNKGAREEFHNAVVAYIMTKLTRAAET